MDTGDPGAPNPQTPPAVVAQLLATEHWSLLATRGTMWSEVMSRITILLTVLTGSLVILGLVAQAGGFGATFQVLAIGLAVVGLILGTLTSVRVFLASDEDAGLILAMNQLRAAYTSWPPASTSTSSPRHGSTRRGSCRRTRSASAATRWSTSSAARTSSWARSTPWWPAPWRPSSRGRWAPLSPSWSWPGSWSPPSTSLVFLWAGYRTFGARQRMLRSALA